MESIDTKSVQLGRNVERNVSVSSALWFHLICGLGIVIGFWVSHFVCSIDLLSNPDRFLFILWATVCPIVILMYAVLRRDLSKCSYLRAVGRGLLGLPAGALVIALCAVALGAPVGKKYFLATVNWSLLMSLFTVVPTATFLAHRLWTGNAYLLTLGQLDPLTICCAFQHMVPSWGLGLGRGLCRLIGKDHGRNGLFVSLVVEWLGM